VVHGAKGAFEYGDAQEDARYYFYLQVFDKAGLSTPEPTDDLVLGASGG